MALDAYPVRSGEPDRYDYDLVLEGGSAAISIVSGSKQGVTASRTGTGVYRLTFNQLPGAFRGWQASLGAATPSAVAGHTAIRDEWDATNKRLDFTVFNASDSAHDLAADEYIDITVRFTRTPL
jgi:hypothetical protein